MSGDNHTRTGPNHGGRTVLIGAGIALVGACIVLSAGACAIATVGLAGAVFVDGVAVREQSVKEAAIASALTLVAGRLGGAVKAASTTALGASSMAKSGYVAREVSLVVAYDAPAILAGVGLSQKWRDD